MRRMRLVLLVIILGLFVGTLGSPLRPLGIANCSTADAGEDDTKAPGSDRGGFWLCWPGHFCVWIPIDPT